MDELFNQIQKLIAEKLEIDESKITLDSSFRVDLGGRRIIKKTRRRRCGCGCGGVQTV